MAKTYTKNTWTDEILAEAALHSITDPTGTPVPGNTTDIESVITALNALLDILSSGAKISLETDVVQAGTSLDATKMNNIENGIDALDDILDLENLTGKAAPISGDKLLLADSEDNYAHKSVDISDVGGSSAPATTAENDFQVGDGSGSWIKKTLAETKTILAVLENIVEDTTPQLGGNLDLQQFSIQFPAGEPSSDDTAVGIIESVTVDTNSTGIGCPLYWGSDGHMDECDADAIASMPCSALALETGTGEKKVLLFGKIRNDDWTWTAGQIIYVSTTVGTLTATAPTGEDDVIQPIGRAISDDCIMFNPTMVYITHTAA